MTILEAKERIRIPDLWSHMKLIGNPPKSDGVTCSPFREDSSPSFSIFDDGRRFKDHGTGEAGDAITFYSLACCGIDNRQATKEFMNLAKQWK